MVGVLAATIGTAAHQLTGERRWDAVASLAIAALLAFVAVRLGQDARALLIGAAADPAVRLVAADVLTGHREIVAIKEMLTMQLGPAAVLVGARVQCEESLSVAEIQDVCTRIEDEMRERVPSLRQVFLDPSRASDDDLGRGRRALARTVDEVRYLEGEAGLQRLRTATGRRGG